MKLLEDSRGSISRKCQSSNAFLASYFPSLAACWLLFWPLSGTCAAGAALIMSSRSNPVLRRSSARLLAFRTTTKMRSMRSLQQQTEEEVSDPSSLTTRMSTPTAKRPRVVSASPSTGSSATSSVRFAAEKAAAAVVTPTNVSAAASSGAATEDIQQQQQQHIDDGFVDLGVQAAELRPSATLTTGQCFHWRAIASAGDDVKVATTSREGKTKSAWGSHNATEWIGTLRVPVTGESLVVVLRETPTSVWYRTLRAPADSFDVQSFLHSYFQLPGNETTDVPSLQDLYQEWSTQCDRLRIIASSIPGVRIVDQDPWECLVSFLCSSNNNIPRITKMLNAIRREYGEPLCTITSDSLGEGKILVDSSSGKENEVFYSFPSLEKLKECATEDDLRSKCGMGYRAKYLIKTMTILDSLGGESYLQELRTISDPVVVQEKLIQFQGVGRKVADCVALFSLRQCDAIPVDVHVWDIARRDYGADALMHTAKSLTPTIYKQVGDLFRTRFPNKSGWAHSLLFVAELPSFRPALPDDIVEEMEKVRRLAAQSMFAYHDCNMNSLFNPFNDTQFRLETKTKKEGK